MQNIQTKTPAEIDEKLCELSSERATHLHRATRYAKFADDYRAGNYGEHVIEKYENLAADEQDKADAFLPEIIEIEREYNRRGGWTRYYLVENVNGHVHRSTNCSTCRATTNFSFVFQCSGMNGAELIELAGERVCTVCFPDAPVTDRKSMLPQDVASREAAAAAAAEKAAAKAEKAKKWVAENGAAIKCANGERPKTRRSAEIAAVNAYADAKKYELITQRGERNPDAAPERVAMFRTWAAEHAETVEQCVAGLLLAGVETESDIRAKIVEKGDKKFAKMHV